MGKLDRKKLKDFTDKDLAGFSLVTGFFLKIDHSCMGTHPALISGTDEIAVCLDKDLLLKVRNTLPHRDYKVVEINRFLVNPELGIGFDMSVEHPDQESLHILTKEEIQQRIDRQKEPFCWVRGVISFEKPRPWPATL